MKKVAIVGIGMTVWGRYPDRTVVDLAREAIDAALKNADLDWKEIQYVVGGIDPYAGYTGMTIGPNMEATLGYIGVPATSIFNACATGAYALDFGRALIASQFYDTVLCVASFKAPGGFFPTFGRGDDPSDLDAQRFRLLGKTNPSMFAFQAVRRMHNFGMTETDMAQVKVKNSKNGKLNPYARYQREFTLEEVISSQMVAYPLRLYEITATSDGAAAIVICSERKARQLTSKKVYLAASYAPQPLYPNLDIGLSPFSTQSEISTQAIPEGEERAHECQVARGALEQAGIGPADLDLVECYDLTTPMEFDWIEDIGICGKGEAELLLREGATTIGGRIPVNPSGGLSSFGEAASSQGLLQLCELVTQLRGNAGPRQVEGAKVGLAINKGLGNSISCMIVQK